jgi:transcriptional regulator GlxA family with amidase domain
MTARIETNPNLSESSPPSNKSLRVAVAIYKGVDDFSAFGPALVFNTANRVSSRDLFDVYTVGSPGGSIRTASGARVLPDFDADSAPLPDLLVLPGADGTRTPLDDRKFIEWLAEALYSALNVITICTGIRLLSPFSMTKGLTVPSHPEAVSIMTDAAPHSVIVTDRRVVQNGRIVCAAQLLGGIEAALELLRTYAKPNLTNAVVTAIEYALPQKPTDS